MTIASTSRAAAATLGLALGLAAAAAPAALAYSGSSPACGGTSIIGGGSSSQELVQSRFGADVLAGTAGRWSTLATIQRATKGFGFSGAPGTGCPFRRAAGQTVGYAPVGSVAGLNAWASDGIARDSSANFLATEEPPTPAEQSKMQTLGMAFNTPIETIPVAQTAIAIIVSLPTGCSISSTGRGTTLRGLDRLYFQEFTRWKEVLGTTALTPASCGDILVKPAARRDPAGASFALKRVLAKAPGGAHWTTPRDYNSPSTNTIWPAPVDRPAAAGAKALADLVTRNPGTVGYVDLATARAKGFGFSGPGDTRFWLRVNAAAAGGTTITNDPSKDPRDPATTLGANCGTSRAYTGTPASTQSNWYPVTGAKATYATGEYPICTLSYALAYDRYSAFGGSNPGPIVVSRQTEPQARMVFDYLGWVTQSTGGQSLLSAGDHQPLPASLRTLAAAGAARINW